MEEIYLNALLRHKHSMQPTREAFPQSANGKNTQFLYSYRYISKSSHGRKSGKFDRRTPSKAKGTPKKNQRKVNYLKQSAIKGVLNSPPARSTDLRTSIIKKLQDAQKHK